MILAGLMPPTGVLTPNEEQYFQLAHAWVDPSARPEPRAAFDASRHRIVSELLVGHAVRALGYGGAQALLRSLLVVALAVGYGVLAASLGVGWRGSTLALVGFHLFHQHILGHEWLFYSVEAKTLAYPFAFGALAAAFGDRPAIAVALLAVATHLHFQVGGFWALVALAHLGAARGRRVAAAAAAYVLLVAPMALLVVADRAALGDVGSCDRTATRVAYAMERNAHHVAPFASRELFLEDWAERVLVLLLLTGIALWRRPRTAPALRPAANVVVACLAYLDLALLLSALDRRTLHLAPLYLFRPSSLTLLLMLLVAGGMAETTRALRKPAAALLVALLALGASARGVRHVAREVVQERRLRPAHDALVASVDSTVRPGAALLLDPLVEGRHLELHRRIPRGTVVCWKIVPTNDRDLCDWRRRLAWRDALFADPARWSPSPEGIQAARVVLVTDDPARAADWRRRGVAAWEAVPGWLAVEVAAPVP